jgi:formylglycine-generating enzyme required for sulfatase activity
MVGSSSIGSRRSRVPWDHGVDGLLGMENSGRARRRANLAGNVWEWMLDGYAAAYQNPCADCAHLASSATRVVRGGGFGALGAVASDLRTANRTFDQAPDARVPGVGARCARRP